MLLDPCDPEAWPHQFTKNGRGYEIGPGVYAQTYICVHCLLEYIQGVQEPPPNPCAARNTKREMKRILR